MENEKFDCDCIHMERTNYKIMDLSFQNIIKMIKIM